MKRETEGDGKSDTFPLPPNIRVHELPRDIMEFMAACDTRIRLADIGGELSTLLSSCSWDRDLKGIILDLTPAEGDSSPHVGVVLVKDLNPLYEGQIPGGISEISDMAYRRFDQEVKARGIPLTSGLSFQPSDGGSFYYALAKYIEFSHEVELAAQGMYGNNPFNTRPPIHERLVAGKVSPALKY